ncbi:MULTISPECIES: hypothetical protein [unclassified Thioalkalivibrio]|uniref:hypothetical protein n=1 Tax=unclassified Thioalkalivibrio TaxID=2621013 RepID=UPI00036DD9BF|nr:MULTISPECIES: hypothetical protein [unclassified Thioalkalivibrio]
MNNPFARYDETLGREIQTVDTDSRRQMVDRFTLEECRDALEVPGLQKTVRARVESRVRKLEKQLRETS